MTAAYLHRFAVAEEVPQAHYLENLALSLVEGAMFALDIKDVIIEMTGHQAEAPRTLVQQPGSPYVEQTQ